MPSRKTISADYANGSEQAVGELAAAMLPQHRPRRADDVAVRGGGAAAPGETGRTCVERLQKCEKPFGLVVMCHAFCVSGLRNTQQRRCRRVLRRTLSSFL